MSLSVMVKSASGLPNVERFSKSDPMTVITFQGEPWPSPPPPPLPRPLQLPSLRGLYGVQHLTAPCAMLAPRTHPCCMRMCSPCSADELSLLISPLPPPLPPSIFCRSEEEDAGHRQQLGSSVERGTSLPPLPSLTITLLASRIP